MIPWIEIPSFSLGPLTVQAFGVLVAIGIVVGFNIGLKHVLRSGLEPAPYNGFLLWGVLGGILGGHLVHLFLYHPEELSLLRFLQVWNGLSSLGGILGAVVAMRIYFGRRKISFAAYADSFAMGIAPAWCIGRVGCFVAHDHPGLLTHFVLAVQYPGGARHDLGLYDAMLLFCITVLVHVLDRRKVLRGRLLAVVAISYGLVRFFFDFLRATDVPYADARYGGLTPGQYICFLLILWGGWWIFSGFHAAKLSPQGQSKSGALKG